MATRVLYYKAGGAKGAVLVAKAQAVNTHFGETVVTIVDIQQLAGRLPPWLTDTPMLGMIENEQLVTLGHKAAAQWLEDALTPMAPAAAAMPSLQTSGGAAQLGRGRTCARAMQASAAPMSREIDEARAALHARQLALIDQPMMDERDIPVSERNDQVVVPRGNLTESRSKFHQSPPEGARFADTELSGFRATQAPAAPPRGGLAASRSQFHQEPQDTGRFADTEVTGYRAAEVMAPPPRGGLTASRSHFNRSMLPGRGGGGAAAPPSKNIHSFR